MSSFYTEVTIHVYDQGELTWATGPYRTQEVAERMAAKLEARLTRGKAKLALDEKYGAVGEYNVTVLARRFRRLAELIAEVIENDSLDQP